jgi:signal transduction histidine kinase
MSDDSPFYNSIRTAPDGRGSQVRSIATKARRIVFLGLSLTFLMGFIAISGMRIQNDTVDYLVLDVGPAVQINNDIFRHMTEAQAELLSFQASHDLKLMIPYRTLRVRILLALTQLDRQLPFAFAKDEPEEITEDLGLQIIQRATVTRWLAYANGIELAIGRGETTSFAQEVALFDSFRQANSNLDAHLVIDRNKGWSSAQSASRIGIAAMLIVVFVAMVLTLVLGLRLARKISKPIIDLSDVMQRQSEGDRSAYAKENYGSLETRDMSHKFNLLIKRQTNLLQTQEHALHMHEFTTKIEHKVHRAANSKQALEIICSALGEGLGVDRVIVNTFNDEDALVLVAQWHLDDLPPLGGVPDELAKSQKILAETLWSSGENFVSHHCSATEEQSEGSKLFYRYTNAQADIAVPIGVDGKIIGMVHIIMVRAPRHWEEFEIVAIRRIVMFVTQFIIDDNFRTQQKENIETLMRLDRQKLDFVNTVNHELRTPLTLIIGYLEVLRNGYDGELSDKQLQLIAILDRNADRLFSLVNNLLALASSENIKYIKNAVNISVSEIITECIQELHPTINRDLVTLDISACPNTAVIYGDRGQLKSVINNIVSNAIKFSHPDGLVSICCIVYKNTKRVKIIVEDHGIGIPVADQSEVFTQFFRASNAITKAIPGTGLGLSIAQQIVKDHDGELTFDSVENEGTTVTVDLPLADV